MLKALLEEAAVNPTMGSLEEWFGLAPLIGASLAILGDVRIGHHTDQAKLVERFLGLSGEEPIAIDQKFKGAVTVRLRTRVLILSNDVPRLYDPSRALASRFIVCQLRRSFLGQEDTTLESKLLVEMPGIFQWAVKGWESLHARGHFVEPAASADAVEDLEVVGSPHGLFVREICALGMDRRIGMQELYERWCTWCRAGGREPGHRERFGADLKSVCPNIRVVQPTRPDGTRYRAYEGIGLA